MTISALKFLTISQKLFTYCPAVFDDQPLNNVSIFKHMFTTWHQIAEKQIPNHQDNFRCPFFTKLISHLASNINFKLEFLAEYGEFVDSGYNLRGISDHCEFLNNIEGKPTKLQRKSPL